MERIFAFLAATIWNRDPYWANNCCEGTRVIVFRGGGRGPLWAEIRARPIMISIFVEIIMSRRGNIH